MFQVLDLSVILTPPPAGADPQVLASIALRCDALGLSHHGDLLSPPLTESEREDLQWYLEEYWQWPYEQFRERGKRIEQRLSTIGKRLYDAVFGTVQANRILQAWRLQSGASRQISIVSGIPAVLSLPWELLHDEQGFLVLRTRQPVSLMRRLPQQELAALRASFQPPLRILLVTARPEGTGFIDPRSAARELFDEMQEQMETGTVVVEILRPPTLRALRHRLKDTTHPVHLLHFDGHGTFGEASIHQDERRKNDGEQGRLAFEDTESRLALVEASVLAQVLQDSGVHLAVLDACQSAMGSADDAFSSVAARLIQGGIDAVIAMSASVLVASSTRYVGAFYRELAQGTSVPVAQERARQALHDDPRRYLSRRRDEEGTPVELRDWWLPHYYQQRPLVFSSTKPIRKSKRKQMQAPITRLSEHMPPEPRSGFIGRARELLLLERSLIQGKLVIIHGFGGMGKTVLAREVADWFTRTRMYQGACFVSFEHGQGNASILLSRVGFLLGVYDGAYIPDDPKKALARLQAALKERSILVIADNLESILPGGEAPLETAERTALWDVLLELQRLGAGVLLTSRTTAFGDGRLAEGAHVMYLRLAGLLPTDAYTLATSLLDSLHIDRRRSPSELLREVLGQLGHHPLAIQLILPALRSFSLREIQHDFAALLPRFTDDTETGRNRSLLASLEYSLTHLSAEQRVLLPQLSVFEGGTLESNLLEITKIEEATWTELRLALEQAALLTVEHPFLHFHPVLVPYLQSQTKAIDESLLEHHALKYQQTSREYFYADRHSPIQVRFVVQRELSNLRRAFLWLLETGHLEEAVDMADSLGHFLTVFGLHHEHVQLQQRLSQALAVQVPQSMDTLTQTEYLHETNLSEEELRTGQLSKALTRLQHLLARIEAQPEGALHGSGSFAHVVTLARLGRCFMTQVSFSNAEQAFRRANTLIEVLLLHDGENQIILHQQAALLAHLGSTLLLQGQYAQAKMSHEQSLQIKERIGDLRGQAVSRAQLGTIALKQGEDAEAQHHYQVALVISQTLSEPALETAAWYYLGTVAQEQQDWPEAERCYRESLSLNDQVGDLRLAAKTRGQLGQVAEATDRFEEAKGWYQRAIALSQQADPTSVNYAEHAGHLTCLALLLIKEVLTGTAQDVSLQLEEAQRYAEQALAIQRVLHDPDPQGSFILLAIIAGMRGDQEAFQQAFEALSAQNQQVVMKSIHAQQTGPRDDKEKSS